MPRRRSGNQSRDVSTRSRRRNCFQHRHPSPSGRFSPATEPRGAPPLAQARERPPRVSSGTASRCCCAAATRQSLLRRVCVDTNSSQRTHEVTRRQTRRSGRGADWLFAAGLVSSDAASTARFSLHATRTVRRSCGERASHWQRGPRSGAGGANRPPRLLSLGRIALLDPILTERVAVDRILADAEFARVRGVLVADVEVSLCRLGRAPCNRDQAQGARYQPSAGRGAPTIQTRRCRRTH